MVEEKIYSDLETIFHQVIGDESIKLTATTTAQDVEGWDSMNHIFIVVEIERLFEVKFHAAEMEELKNVGELVLLIDKRSPRT